MAFATPYTYPLCMWFPHIERGKEKKAYKFQHQYRASASALSDSSRTRETSYIIQTVAKSDAAAQLARERPIFHYLRAQPGE